MDPELFKQMQEAARRFNAGESDFEEIITPAGPAHLVRDADDPRGFRLDFVDDGATRSVPVQEYPASASRTPGYPAPLPFLAHCAARVDTSDQSVTWVDPPYDAIERVVRESIEDGWVALETQPTASSADGAVRALEKDGVERSIFLTSRRGRPWLVLRERRPASED